jgi:hypothetical protein
VRGRDLQPVTYPVAARNPRGIIDSQPKIVMLPNRAKFRKTKKLKRAIEYKEEAKGIRCRNLELTRWKVHQQKPQFCANTQTL